MSSNGIVAECTPKTTDMNEQFFYITKLLPEWKWHKIYCCNGQQTAH